MRASVERSWRGLVAEIDRNATRSGRARTGRFAIEGLRLHERALRAGAGIEAVLIGRSLAAAPSVRERELLDALAVAGASLRVGPDAVLTRLTAGRGLGAIVGLLRIPEPPSLETLLGDIDALAPCVVLCAVDVSDPGNTGALVRTAHALGARALLAVGDTDPFHPRAVRTSMGSVFKLPLLRLRAAREGLGELARFGIRTLGAVSRGGTPLPELVLAGPRHAIVLGNEAFGLSDGIRGCLDALVEVPMARGVDSLSASSAAAVLLYDVARRCGALGPGAPCTPLGADLR